jgi:hypothetical protein
MQNLSGSCTGEQEADILLNALMGADPFGNFQPALAGVISTTGLCSSLGEHEWRIHSFL